MVLGGINVVLVLIEYTPSNYFASIVVTDTSVIAAVRLARDYIGRPSPRITATVMDRVGLARAILNGVLR